jgi:hypothetical protein
MRTRCPVCNGHKRMFKPEMYGKPFAYCGANGERFPPSCYEECQNCCGTGWVGKPDVNAADPYLP